MGKITLMNILARMFGKESFGADYDTSTGILTKVTTHKFLGKLYITSFSQSGQEARFRQEYKGEFILTPKQQVALKKDSKFKNAGGTNSMKSYKCKDGRVLYPVRCRKCNKRSNTTDKETAQRSLYVCPKCVPKKK